jgi:hypothetical protein
MGFAAFLMAGGLVTLRKLNIHSRAELVRLFSPERAPATLGAD